jgi:hypothetical protein
LNSRSRLIMKMLGAALVAGAPMGVACAAEGSGWDWAIAPYLWAPTIGSSLNVDVPPANTSDTTQFSDIAGNLGFTVPLHLEGQGDDWGVFSDLLYLPLSNTRHNELFSTDTSLKAGIFELGGVWSPGERRHEGFEALAGLRYLWETLDTKILPVDPDLQGSKVRIDKSFVDFLIGARYTARLSERWALTLRGDGSFGGTDGTYGASGMFEYDTSNGAWLFGYRYMKLKFSDSNASVDLKLYGPEVAYAFRF